MDPRRLVQPAAGFEASRRFRPQGRGEWGIQKDEIESPGGLGEPVEGIGADDAASGNIQAREGRLQLLRQSAIALDEYAFPRAARNRLDSQGAGARVEIQATRAFDHGRQPVEQGFAQAIAAGSQFVAVDHVEAAAAQGSADDAQLAGFAGGGGWHGNLDSGNEFSVRVIACRA